MVYARQSLQYHALSSGETRTFIPRLEGIYMTKETDFAHYSIPPPWLVSLLEPVNSASCLGGIYGSEWVNDYTAG